MRYFLVTAKCGHVGKSRYYEGRFPVMAETAKAAAQMTKNFSRVKTNHKDVILEVIGISDEEYHYYLEEFENQIYFYCRSKKEQTAHWNEIEPYIRQETKRQMQRLAKYNDYYKNNKHFKGIRNPYKYEKYNHCVA